MKILIAIPCMDTVPTVFTQSLAMLQKVGDCAICMQVGSLVYDARNKLAEQAIKMGADLVFWLDSDMVFEPSTLVDMVKTLTDNDLDFLTGIYYRRTPPFSAVAFKTMELNEEGTEFKWTEFDEIPNEPFEVGACGFGCVLMKTEIFVAVFSKFGQMFTPIVNCCEDIAFCWRARQCGYKIIADPSIELGHVGHTVITKEFFKNYQLTLKAKGERGE